MAKFLGLITLFLVSLVLETIGLRVTTLRVLSLLIQSLMLSGRKPKTVIACKVCKMIASYLILNFFDSSGS